MVPHAHQRGADELNGLLPHTLILPCHLREGGREGGGEIGSERGRKRKERRGGGIGRKEGGKEGGRGRGEEGEERREGGVSKKAGREERCVCEVRCPWTSPPHRLLPISPPERRSHPLHALGSSAEDSPNLLSPGTGLRCHLEGTSKTSYR